MQEGIYVDNFDGHACPGCKALRARLAEIEAQRDGLKEALELISSGDYKNAATNCFAAVAVGIANRALAKLEEK